MSYLCCGEVLCVAQNCEPCNVGSWAFPSAAVPLRCGEAQIARECQSGAHHNCDRSVICKPWTCFLVALFPGLPLALSTLYRKNLARGRPGKTESLWTHEVGRGHATLHMPVETAKCWWLLKIEPSLSLKHAQTPLKNGPKPLVKLYNSPENSRAPTA